MHSDWKFLYAQFAVISVFENNLWKGKSEKSDKNSDNSEVFEKNWITNLKENFLDFYLRVGLKNNIVTSINRNYCRRKQAKSYKKRNESSAHIWLEGKGVYRCGLKEN